MRRIWAVLFVLLLAWPLAAQQRTGNIYGTVVDQEGNPLPGVNLTLTQTTIAPMTAVSTAEGRFRFLSLFPANDYVIKGELSGFKPLTQSGIIVSVGANSEIKLTMEMGKLEEEVTVTAVTPIVETKKTAVTQTVNYAALQSLPSARDPWVILQMTPSILVDRENVGGNESGQQSSYVSKGGDQYQSQWVLDGVLITDPAARGGSPTYFDFDVFEEMQVTTGGMDVETQLGGVALNLVTRRGGNRISLGGRFYLADEKFQNKISPEQIKKLGVPGYNRVIETKDFGFNVGGPLLKDKIWWWGSYGLQDIKTTVIAGTRDDTLLTNLAGKINLQLLPQNRAELFIHAGKKEKWGRSASTSYPSGWVQHGKYHFGSPILKIQDEHMFGDNLFISLKYGFTDAGFGLWPQNDQDIKEMKWYNVEGDLYERTNTWFFSGRPNAFYSAAATYFNDSLFGVSHEIKFGVELTDRYIDYVSAYPGGPANMRVNYNYDSPTVDWNGDGKREVVRDVDGFDIKHLSIDRQPQGQYGTKSYSGYISDTITAGRFNFKLGVRFDRQHPWVGKLDSFSLYTKDSDATYVNNYYEITQKYMTPGTAEKIKAIFPDKSAPNVDPDYNWDMWSPRFGMTWDIFGDGKTIAKLSGATYGEYMGIIGGYWSYGGLEGTMDFWWNDVNKDEKADWRELYWAEYTSARKPYRAFDDAGNFVGNWAREYGYMYSGFNYLDPLAYEKSYYVVDPNWKSNRTWELLFTLEKELTTDLGVAVDLTYRLYDRLHVTLDYWPDTKHVESRDDYMVAGTVPSSWTDAKTGKVYNFKEAAGKPWYVWKKGVEYTDYSYRTNWPNERHNAFYGVDFRFNKRLSNKWMMNGSFSLGWQPAYYGSNQYNYNTGANLTNVWSLEGEPYAYSIGGASGKLAQPAYSLWMGKLQALYQLPLDFDVSVTVTAREGWIIPETFNIYDYTLPNPSSQSASSLNLRKYGDLGRLPTNFYANARVQKLLRAGERGRIYLMADCFNVLNSDTLNRQRAIGIGSFYVQDHSYKVTARSGEPNEVLNPRLFRFGVRFEF